MLIDTDQIHENATKVEGLERRLTSVEGWLNSLKAKPVHKTPTDWTIPTGEPVGGGSLEEPRGKVITFSGDGFEYTCGPIPSEPVGMAPPAPEKPGFNPFGAGELVITNDSEKTRTYTVTIAAGVNDVPLDIVDSDDRSTVKSLKRVPAGKCQTRTFDLKPGQAFSPTESGSYKIEAVN